MRGQWFDGPAGGVPVEVRPEGKALRAVGLDGVERVRLEYEGTGLSIGGTDGAHLVLARGERVLFVEREGALAALEGVAPEWFVVQVRALGAARRVRWAWTRALLLGLAGLLLAALVAALVNLRALAVHAVPAAWERAVGAELWDLSADRRPVDPRLRGFVEATVRRLAAARERQAGGGQAFQVRVTHDPEVNAYALPGGFMVVNAGLVAAADSPDEVAGVLGHEMGHVVGRHAVEHAVDQVGVWTLVTLLVDPGSALASLRPLLSLRDLAGSREQEREADAFGARLLRSDGLDAGAMAAFFERLAAKEGAADVALLRTHPPSAERAADLRALVAALPPGPAASPLCTPAAWAEVQEAARASR